MSDTKAATSVALDVFAGRYRRLMLGWLVGPFFGWLCSLCLAVFYSDYLLAVLPNWLIPSGMLLSAWLFSAALAACMWHRTPLRWYILSPQFEALYLVLTVPLFILVWLILPVVIQLSVVSWLGLLMVYFVFSLSIRRIARAKIDAETQAHSICWSRLSQLSLRDILFLRVPHDFV